jgi:antitoxin component of RelBE/YafQ-DinJ toxin-antitoxin module
MNKTNFINIRIDDQEKAIVQKKMDDTGLGLAASVRVIIREWAEMRKGYITVPIRGIVKADGVVAMKEAGE